MYGLPCSAVIFRVYDKEVCRWPHHVNFFDNRHIFELLLLFSMLVLALWSLYSKYPPGNWFFSLVLISSYYSNDATSSLPLLSGFHGIQIFRFKASSDVNRRFPGFAIFCPISTNRRVSAHSSLLSILSRIFFVLQW